MLVGTLVALVVVVTTAMLLRSVLVHLRASAELLRTRVAEASHVVHCAAHISTGCAGCDGNHLLCPGCWGNTGCWYCMPGLIPYMG